MAAVLWLSDPKGSGAETCVKVQLMVRGQKEGLKAGAPQEPGGSREQDTGKRTGMSQPEWRQWLLIQESDFILVAGKRKKIIGNFLRG